MRGLQGEAVLRREARLGREAAVDAEQGNRWQRRAAAKRPELDAAGGGSGRLRRVRRAALRGGQEVGAEGREPRGGDEDARGGVEGAEGGDGGCCGGCGKERVGVCGGDGGMMMYKNCDCATKEKGKKARKKKREKHLHERKKIRSTHTKKTKTLKKKKRKKQFFSFTFKACFPPLFLYNMLNVIVRYVGKGKSAKRVFLAVFLSINILG